MRRAAEKHPEISLFGGFPPLSDLLVDLSVAELQRRVGVAVRRAACEAGGRAYIGSTTCPMWRWEGGPYWDDDSTQKHMPGHRLQWGKLLVLGSWSDEVVVGS